MFTGLVEAIGTVRSIERLGEQARLRLEIPFLAELALGDSVAVNGCCLTVAELEPDCAAFDLLAQTMEVTSLGQLGDGSDVNLERAMQIGDRFGGHFVLGHVDGTGPITAWEPRGQDFHLVVEVPQDLLRYCIDKGSLSIDGISLTIAAINGPLAEFWITPHTSEVTHLRSAKVGQKVNLEVDMLAKHVEKLLENR